MAGRWRADPVVDMRLRDKECNSCKQWPLVCIEWNMHSNACETSRACEADRGQSKHGSVRLAD